MVKAIRPTTQKKDQKVEKTEEVKPIEAQTEQAAGTVVTAEGVSEVLTGDAATTTSLSEEPSPEGSAPTETESSEVPPAEETKPEAPQEPAPAPVEVKETPVQAEPEIKPSAIPVASLAQGAAVQHLLLNNLDSYAQKMRPGMPVSVADGVANQVLLYRTLTAIINNLREGEFVSVFGEVLRRFHEGRQGIFSEMYVFRFPEHLTLTKDEQTAFHRLLNLMIVAADPKGRSLIAKQVNIQATCEFGISEQGRSNLLNFFNL